MIQYNKVPEWFHSSERKEKCHNRLRQWMHPQRIKKFEIIFREIIMGSVEAFSTRTQKDQLLLTLEITFKIQIYPFLSCLSFCVYFFGKREAFRMHGEILKDPTWWSVSVPG